MPCDMIWYDMIWCAVMYERKENERQVKRGYK